MSPTQRSMKLLKGLGYHPAIVERWNMYAHIRQDLYNAIDIIAVHQHKSGVLGVQVTSSTNIQSRLEKASSEPMRAWLMAGNQYVLHIWYKGKKQRGDKRVIWKLRERVITLDDIC